MRPRPAFSDFGNGRAAPRVREPSAAGPTGHVVFVLETGGGRGAGALCSRTEAAWRRGRPTFFVCKGSVYGLFCIHTWRVCA